MIKINKSANALVPSPSPSAEADSPKMVERRGARAALVGSSVHNQPIEQLWGLINDRCTLPFRQLFERLTRQGILNTDNETDMMCLHLVFVPLIQDNLTRLAK